MSSSVIEHAEIDFNLLLILGFWKYAFCSCYTLLSLLLVPLILYFCCTESQLVISVPTGYLVHCYLEMQRGILKNVYGYFFELTCYS